MITPHAKIPRLQGGSPLPWPENWFVLALDRNKNLKNYIKWIIAKTKKNLEILSILSENFMSNGMALIMPQW